MALPNDSILVTPGSGATVATHTVSSKEYPTVIVADAEGHLLGSGDVYFASSTVISPSVTAGNTNICLFNPSASGKRLLVLAICMTTQGTVNKTHRVVRTTSGGSGGTAITPFKRDTDSLAPVGTVQVLPTTQPTGKDSTVGLRLEQPIETGGMPAFYDFRSYPIELLQAVGLALDSDDTLVAVTTVLTLIWQEVAV
ncbi:MAG: hypothetical protein HY323_05510 [Betaproteobacteria bacterium]|nr:hypothetical protein [Betaproteobacteria bacterium]